MGKNHEFEMATKVEKMHNLAYDKAKEMLQKNRPVLEQIVEQLLMFENLTGHDLLNIVEKYGGIQEKEPFSLSGGFHNEITGGSSYDNTKNEAVIELLDAAT